MATVEILRARKASPTGEPMLRAIADAAGAAGDQVIETREFRGCCDWLVLFGVGAPVNDAARRQQIAFRGRVLHWDHGYFGRQKITGYLRMSIDSDHPQQWLDRTPGDPVRWDRHGIKLHQGGDALGPILLIGLGRKSRIYLNTPDWERQMYERLRTRFPGRTILFRPKGDDDTQLPCERDATTPIEKLLRGASLVVCRHSNVAVDAAIAGVPFEAEDGAAMWLQRREYTPANRLEFLKRLAFWQWRATEAAQAWAFAKGIVK